MREYELMVILAPDLGEETTAQTLQRVQDLIVNGGGQVSEVDDWGLRRLAYEVNDYRDGYYSVIRFQGATALVDELERALRLMEPIMRQLVVRLSEV